jgi:hypothetical protein
MPHDEPTLPGTPTTTPLVKPVLSAPVHRKMSVGDHRIV